MIREILLVSLLSSFLSAITLDKAIEIGLENSPTLKISKNRVMISNEAKKIKKYSNFGKISVKGSYTKYNIPRTLTPITPPIQPGIVTSQTIGTLGVAYDVVLFNGFSTSQDIAIARLGEDASILSADISKDELVYNIQSLYLKILSLKSQKKGAYSHKKALSKLLKIVKVGVSAGKKAKIELYRIKSDLEIAKMVIKELDSNIKILKATLASVIGIKNVGKLHDIEFEKSGDLVKSDIKELRRYKLAQIQEKKGDKNIQKAKSSYFPVLSLNGYYGDNYGDGESDEIWQVGVGMNWLLFDFGVREARVAKAKIEKLQTIQELKKMELGLEKNLEEAKMKVEIAKAKVKSSYGELKFVKRTLKIEKVRYEEGVSTIYDLLFALSRYQNSKARAINSRYALQSELYYYNYINEIGNN